MRTCANREIQRIIPGRDWFFFQGVHARTPFATHPLQAEALRHDLTTER